MEKIKEVLVVSNSIIAPIIDINYRHVHYYGEKTYNEQIDYLADSILLDHKPQPKFNSAELKIDLHLKLINKGEVISGSSVMRIVNTAVTADDIDIYFHSIDDAMEFAKINGVEQQVKWHLAYKPEVLNTCSWITVNGCKYNLIWGIKYNNMEDLLTGFDIRACAMGIDLNNHIFTAVDGALGDTELKRIVWQPTAQVVSVWRMLKYLAKGFTMDKYQRVMFAELIKHGAYRADLELNTGYAGK